MQTIIYAIIIVTAIGLVCGIILALASHFMAVKVDERAQKARACLPGANCGACGYTGCDGYAKALADGETDKTNLCVPGGDVTAKQLSETLGLAFADVEEKVAIVHCNKKCEENKQAAIYDGIGNCRSASLIYGGPEGCLFGCLGFGDCMNACKEGAISIDSGIATIDINKCMGCGVCVKTCPKHIISLVHVPTKTVVKCSNTEKGAKTRAVCSVGCIGCKKCEMNCEAKAITVVDNLARIDYSLCTSCKKCIDLCPVHALELVDYTTGLSAKNAL